MLRSRWILRTVVVGLLLSAACGSYFFGQTPQAGKVERGSQTAKAGFKNEDDIRDKFNNWREDADARAWLAAMNHNLADIESVRAAKPHGKKATLWSGSVLWVARNRKRPGSRRAAEIQRKAVTGQSRSL